MIDFLKKLIVPAIIIAISIFLYVIVKVMINKIFKNKPKFSNNRYKTLVSLVKNIIKYFIFIVAGTMILDHFGVDTKSIVTSLGIIGIVTGLALQDLLKDLVAGISIIIENQYAIGDIVTIDGFKGVVTLFTLKTTRIKAWTGEEKIIANHLISTVINHTHNNSIAVVDVSVAYEEDVDKIEKVLNKLCDTMKNKVSNLKGDIQVSGIEDLAESAVVFRVTAEVKPGEQYVAQREIRKIIKQEFDKQNISIPYNQLVVHNG